MKPSDKSLKIWDSPNKPDDNSHTIFWQENGLKPTYSLNNFIEENKMEIRGDFLDFIFRLGEKKVEEKRVQEYFAIKENFNLWWMTLIAEKSPYRDNSVKESIKLIALEKLAVKLKINEIQLHSDDWRLQRSVERICKKNNVVFSLKSSNTTALNQKTNLFYRIFPHFFRSLLYFINKLFHKRQVGLKKMKDFFDETENSIFVLSYFDNLDPKKLNEGKFESYYWYKFPNFLNDLDYKINWLHFFIKTKLVENFKEGKKHLEKFSKNNIKNKHQFLDEALTFNALFGAIFSWIKLVFRLIKVIPAIEERISKDELSYLWYFLQEDFDKSIFSTNCIQNIIWVEQFDFLLANIPRQKIGIYLKETQNWEYAFISAWKKYNHGKLIGVAHTPLNFWDLRFFENIDSFSAHVQPDVIALGGNLSLDRWYESGLPKERIASVEALRYQHLDRYKSIKQENDNFQASGDILILGDVMPSTTNRMMNFLNQSHDVLNNFNIFIKSHPNNPIISAQYSKLDLLETNKNLEDLFTSMKYVISTSYTAASLEAYCAGLSVINYIDDSSINFSLLNECEDVFFVNDKNDLLEALNKKVISNQLNTSNFFNLDIEMNLWGELLEQ